jgi:hypothetical protein
MGVKFGLCNGKTQIEVFKIRMPRRISGHKRDEEKAEWRKFRNEKYNMYAYFHLTLVEL